jgi:hypothetical protein
VLGVKDSPDVPVSNDPASHVEVDELYHSTVYEFGPVYATAAASADGVCPTSYARGPGGVTLTVGSAVTVNVNVAVAVFPFPSVTVRVTVYGDVRSSPGAGVQLNEAVVGAPQPEGSPDHA